MNKLTADVARTMPQKYCKTHGKQYIIDKDFSLCCHQDCFPAAVNKMIHKSKIYQHLKTLGVLEDFYSWLQMQLLVELREKNKPPILNFVWLSLKTKNFYSNALHKGIVPLDDLPSKVKKDRTYLPINEEILNEIDNINADTVRAHKLLYYDNPESTLLEQSLSEQVEELTGSVMLAYLNEELTIQDVARINKMSLKETKKWIEENRRILRENIER